MIYITKSYDRLYNGSFRKKDIIVIYFTFYIQYNNIWENINYQSIIL